MMLQHGRQDSADQVEADSRHTDGDEAVAESAMSRRARAEDVAHLCTRLAQRARHVHRPLIAARTQRPVRQRPAPICGRVTQCPGRIPPKRSPGAEPPWLFAYGLLAAPELIENGARLVGTGRSPLVRNSSSAARASATASCGRPSPARTRARASLLSA